MAQWLAALQSGCAWLEASSLGHFVRTTPYLYPMLMSAHVLGIALLVGPAMAVDLRLLGVARRHIAVSLAARLLLPLSHAGFALVAATGLAMLAGIASAVGGSSAAPWKFGLIAVAGVNILLFHRGIYRSVADWDRGTLPPLRARAAAVVSATAWSGVIVAGRFLAY